MSTIQKLSRLLQESESSPSAGQTLRRASALLALRHQVALKLGDELAAHCHLTNARADKLYISCDNGAWANRLRYLAPELSRKMADLLPKGAPQIIVSVSPEQRAASSPKPQGHISPEQAARLKSSAQHLDDETLRASLDRLLDAVGKNPKQPD